MLEIPPKLSISSGDGKVVEIDLSETHLTEAQKAGLKKLAKTGGCTELTENEREEMEKLTIRIGLEDGAQIQALCISSYPDMCFLSPDIDLEPPSDLVR